MKRKLFYILICLLSVKLFAADVTYKEGQTLYVSVKTAKTGKIEFFYGDKVIVDEINGKKILVHLANDEDISGWISIGSVTKKKIIVSDNGSHVRASSDELSLAGKGFSETAENLFKADNPDISFDEVDKMETLFIEEDDLNSFIEEGHLCAN